jgi:CubicO group peptidase (beta-lactamase class C family)
MPRPVTVTCVAEIQGTCDERFDAVRAALADSLDDADVGAAAAVFIDGEPVADLWGGYTDAQRTTRWQQDTITNVWSTTKTMVALCALILADRGDLDLDAPVARYWPEFGAAGKDGVLVRHLLSHTAGLPDFDPPVMVGDLYDWPAAIDRLAKQAPRWEPGTLAGYHSVTQGFLVGEVVRRVTGHSLAAFFADQVAGPLGADFHLTLPAEHDRRFAPGLPPPDAPDGDLTAAPPNTVEGPVEGTAPEPPAGTAIRLSDGNSVAWRRAEMLSASGYGNARSVAAVQSVLACGGSVHGTRLLSKQACERAREEQYRGIDQLLGSSVRYGMGYGIFDRAVGWGGWGGSMVMVNMDSRMTVAYVMNQMLQGGSGDYRGLGIVLAAYEGLER